MPKVNERTVKVILVSRPGSGRYSRWEWRAVECRTDQRGHLNERGVEVLWRSRDLYRPTARYRGSRKTKGQLAEERAVEVANEHLIAALGVNS